MRLQEIIDRLSTNGSLKVRSAANPILWMIAAVGTVVATAMFAGPPGWALGILLAVFSITVLSAIGMIGYMVLRRPDDLRSEEYLLEQKRISLYRDAGAPDKVIRSKELASLPDPKKLDDSDE